MSEELDPRVQYTEMPDGSKMAYADVGDPEAADEMIELVLKSYRETLNQAELAIRNQDVLGFLDALISIRDSAHMTIMANVQALQYRQAEIRRQAEQN